MCLENHQTPDLPAALQKLFRFSGEPVMVCHFLKESFMFRQDFFSVGMAGNRTKLQRRQETHSPEAGLGLPICSASSFLRVLAQTD